MFRTAIPPCMGAKIEAAMDSKLIVEPPRQPEAADNDILQEMNGKAAEPPTLDSEC